MHDCPKCRVPLHGYEDVCPSCGTRQYERKGGRFANYHVEEKGVNVVPFIIAFLAVAIFLFSAIPGSWLGRLMKGDLPQDDPITKIPYSECRTYIETKINEGLAANGATGKIVWMKAGMDQAPIDKMTDCPVTVQIDTALADTEMRKGIIEPIKPYMAQARIESLTMNDSKHHATWTYNVSIPVSADEPDAGLGP